MVSVRERNVKPQQGQMFKQKARKTVVEITTMILEKMKTRFQISLYNLIASDEHRTVVLALREIDQQETKCKVNYFDTAKLR